MKESKKTNLYDADKQCKSRLKNNNSKDVPKDQANKLTNCRNANEYGSKKQATS